MARQTAWCENMGLKKGPWTPDEDHKLLAYIERHGCGNWRSLPEKAGLQRCGKSCRLRWINYLRPDLKRGKFSLQEEQTIIQLHAFLGNRWSAIAAHLPKRTDNEIKNYWNTRIKKRFSKMGIDPTTHKPRRNLIINSTGRNTSGTLNHMAQWEITRLEAEARLAKESKTLLSSSTSTPAAPNQKISINKSSAARSSNKSQCLDVVKAWQSVVSGKFAISSSNKVEPPSDPIIFGSSQGSTNYNEQDSITGIGGTVEDELIMVHNDRSRTKYRSLPEMNERPFDNSMCLHYTTYDWGDGNMVEDFSDILLHDFDYTIEMGESTSHLARDQTPTL